MSLCAYREKRETTANRMNIELLNSKENTYGVGHWVHEHANELLNKCFLRAALNPSKSIIFRRSFGSAFHRTGAAYTKERSPYDLVVIEGTTNKFFVLDLKLRVGLYEINNSDKYSGATLWKHSKAKTSSLNSMRL